MADGSPKRKRNSSESARLEEQLSINNPALEGTDATPESPESSAKKGTRAKRSVSVEAGIGVSGSSKKYATSIDPTQTDVKKDPITAKWETMAIHALDDSPIDQHAQDALGSNDLAEGLEGLMDSRHTTPPIVVGISGPWGSGKSSLARLVERKLKSKPASGAEHPHTVSQFNAWLHSDAAKIETALMKSVAKDLNQKSFYNLFEWRFASPADRFARLATGFLLLTAIGVVLFGWPWTWSWGPTSITIISVLAAVTVSTPVLNSLTLLSKYVRNPSSEASAGRLAQTKAEWGKYVNRRLAPKARLIIFIEDLDRCSPKEALRILEVLNQLLTNDRTIVVLVADMAVLAHQVGKAWTDNIDPTADKQTQINNGFDFMQKIVQLRFEVPRHSAETMRGFIQRLSNEDHPHDQPIRDIVRQKWHDWLVPWQKATWRVGKRPTNPYWSRPFRLDYILFGWWWEAIWISRSVMLMSRRAVIPKSARTEFPPPVSGRELALRLGGVLGGSVLIVTFYAYLMLTAPALGLILLPTAIFFFAPLYLLSYAVPAAFAMGLLMGYRIRQELKGENDPGMSSRIQQIRLLGKIQESTDRYDKLGETELVESALREALRDGAFQPRMAKRILTRLRLEVHCARKRELIGPDSDVTPQLLGKWVVLMERWPAVYQKILDSPSLLSDLERGGEAAYKPLRMKQQAQAELLAFMKRPPELGRSVTKLIQYAP